MTANGSGGKRRGLGRGLGALIVNTQTAPDEVEATLPVALDGILHVPLEAVAPNPHQPRAQFEPAALEELAASIRVHGVIQPLIVTENRQRPGTYWLIAGERRLRAAHLAALGEVPVIVRDASPLQLVEWALVENLQRADLNPLEEAAAYQTLIDEFALTQAEIGQRVGKSRAAVANTVRLLHLPPQAQTVLIEGRISAGHARALLALPDHATVLQALGQVLERELTVRQTEELVKRLLTPPPDKPAPSPKQEEEQPLDDQFAYLENRFRTVLGTRVNLSRNRDGSGRLIVHFYSDDDLSHIYQMIAGEEEF